MFRRAHVLISFTLFTGVFTFGTAANAVPVRGSTTRPAATTTTTTTKVTAAKTQAAAVTTTTSVKPVATTSPAAALYRVQVGAATNKAGATRLAKAAATALPTETFIVTGTKKPFRVVGQCHTSADASALKSALAAKKIAAIVYRSAAC